MSVDADAAEPRRSEEPPKQTDATFRLLFEKSPDAMLLLDGDVFIDCNQAAEKMMRCSSKEQLLALDVYDISPERQPDRVTEQPRYRRAADGQSLQHQVPCQQRPLKTGRGWPHRGGGAGLAERPGRSPGITREVTLCGYRTARESYRRARRDASLRRVVPLILALNLAP